ncbi:hypothetical protein VNO77_13907 [Canavalia gladiata]|uniref:Uncharacterized protein n=1 Tax=Canavalia gladiata TaxID=3824 RepID=A0AAN9LXR0_CANGL
MLSLYLSPHTAASCDAFNLLRINLFTYLLYFSIILPIPPTTNLSTASSSISEFLLRLVPLKSRSTLRSKVLFCLDCVL